MPIGQKIIEARLFLERRIRKKDLDKLVNWSENLPWTHSQQKLPLSEIRITKGAYPPKNLENIEKYLALIQVEENQQVKIALIFALLCVLESVSYTRKDGQYLRWDSNSNRKLRGKVFHKKMIEDFDTAIVQKLKEIINDAKLQQGSLMEATKGEIKCYQVLVWI